MLVFRSVLGLHHCLQACSKEYGGPHPSLCMFLYVWPHFVGNCVTWNIQGTLSSRWWFQMVFIFALTWGNDPLWRIFFQVGWNLKHQQDKLLFKLPCRAFWNADTFWPCRTSSENAMVKKHYLRAGELSRCSLRTMFWTFYCVGKACSFFCAAGYGAFHLAAKNNSARPKLWWSWLQVNL